MDVRLTLATALVVGAVAAGAPAAAQQTTLDGVFTEDQAARGAELFGENCAACHGVSLQGTGEAPPLSGAEFVWGWNGLTLGDLFDRIRKTMPLDRPGALDRETNAAILAYLLEFNGYPAGETELWDRTELLAAILIEAQ